MHRVTKLALAATLLSLPAAPLHAQALQSVVVSSEEPGVGVRQSLLIYTSDCDETIARECGLIEFACGEYGQTVSRNSDGSIIRIEPDISFLAVEPYALADMLRVAADLLPPDLAASRVAGVGLPGEALRISSDQTAVEVRHLDRLSLSYNYMFGYWAVSIAPELGDLTATLARARRLSFDLLGYRETIAQPAILADIRAFILSCDS